MKKVSVPGVELAVVDEGLGPPVLLVHGFPLNHQMWESQIALLTERWRVIAPDLRGFGQSGVTPGKVALEQFAHDLAALLDALTITEPVVLMGLSMGGYIAFEFYRKYRRRLRGLVLCDTRAAADTPETAVSRQETAQRVEREGLGPLADTMLPKLLAPGTFQSRPEVAEMLRRIVLANNPAGIAAAARGMAERADFTALLAHIDCPTLVLVGQQDVVSPPAEMSALAREIPGARLVEIEAAGHLAPLEQPAAVNTAVLDFLAAILPESS